MKICQQHLILRLALHVDVIFFLNSTSELKTSQTLVLLLQHTQLPEQSPWLRATFPSNVLSCSDVPPGHENETQTQKTNVPSLPTAKDFLVFVSHSSQNKILQRRSPLLISRRCEHASTHLHIRKMLLKLRMEARILLMEEPPSSAPGL